MALDKPWNPVPRNNILEKLKALEVLFECDLEQLQKAAYEVLARGRKLHSIQVPEIRIFGVPLIFNPGLTRPAVWVQSSTDGIPGEVVGTPKKGN